MVIPVYLSTRSVNILKPFCSITGYLTVGTVNFPRFSFMAFEMAYLLPSDVTLTPVCHLLKSSFSTEISLLEILPFAILWLFFDQILSAESLK